MIATNQADRRAFTLVELLVVISIIALISSISLFTLYGVREDARESRARSQISRINELIIPRWESYRTRAVPVKTSTSGMDARAASGVRLLALRELMRMELPDRITDLLSPVSDNPLALPAGEARYLKSPPTLWRTYVRRARQQIIAKNGLSRTDPASRDAWKTGWSPQFQQAECLYLILAAIRDGDTTGLDFFTESEIGDADNDGMPEILDPWGFPIMFLRWAPGYRSDLQPGDIEVAEIGYAGIGNGDPFDPLKVDPRWRDGIEYNDPHLLYPLIVCAGRDHSYDILVDFLDVPFPSPLPPIPASAPYLPYLDHNNPQPASPPQQNLWNDPYVTFEHPTLVDPVWGNVVQIGRLADIDGDGVAGYSDNITNHFLEVR